MAHPNTLVFVDFPSDDPEASARFYTEVFGWETEGRPAGAYHRLVPGGEFALADGTASGVANLHLGVYGVRDGRPNPRGYDDDSLPRGRVPRVYVLVSDDDSQDRILATAERLGATILWRDHYWGEFNGFCGAFRDPWGCELVLWSKGGAAPQIPAGFTRS
jgi:catechol 2,3-dioxygenase-like lactoylglutathione lyase family enzyme